MASRAPTTTFPMAGVIRYSWTLNNTDTGVAISAAKFKDKTVHIYGTFGAGGSVTLRGSNKAAPSDATSGDWVTLTDAQANAITKTADAIEVLLEGPLWISPICTAGDGTTAITLDIVVER